MRAGRDVHHGLVRERLDALGCVHRHCRIDAKLPIVVEAACVHAAVVQDRVRAIPAACHAAALASQRKGQMHARRLREGFEHCVPAVTHAHADAAQLSLLAGAPREHVAAGAARRNMVASGMNLENLLRCNAGLPHELRPQLRDDVL